MPDNSKNLSCWAVPAETSLAPVTTPACQIDFADDAATEQPRIVGINHFTDEFVAGRSRKSVVPAKELDIRIANAAAQKSNDSVTLRPSGFHDLSYRRTTLFKVDRDHAG
jgi:hypothetical protein